MRDANESYGVWRGVLIAAVLADGHRVSYFHVREVHRIEDLAPHHEAIWDA